MANRTTLLEGFLSGAGWGSATVEWRPGDASFRRYARLTLGGETAMLMDAPPPKENVRPFLRIGALLAKAGLSTPEVMAADETAGFLLLEDFGDATFTRLLDDGADAEPLYALATEALLQIGREIRARPPGLPIYDGASRTGHLSTVLDWLWPEVLPPGPSAAERAVFNALWRQALDRAPTLGRGLVHRDFHVDNLMRLEGRSGVASCGVLDYQDAAWGPLAYDLASLLEDARRDLDRHVKAACLERYMAARPDLDAQTLAHAVAVHGGQRHMRVAGLWVRLWRRDGKTGYLKHMRRTLTLLEASLAHPALAEVGRFLDKAFPETARADAVLLAERQT